jgi:hypothetical protein
MLLPLSVTAINISMDAYGSQQMLQSMRNSEISDIKKRQVTHHILGSY